MAQELQFPKRWQKEFSTVNPIFRNDTITICFLGDVMMHTKQIETARQGESGYDFSSYFMLIEDKIRNADLAVANMEFPLGGEPYSGYPVFSAPLLPLSYMWLFAARNMSVPHRTMYSARGSGAENTGYPE